MKKLPVFQCPPCLPLLLLYFIPKLWKSLWAAGDWDLNWPKLNRERAKQGSELELLTPYEVIIAKKQPPPLSILGLSRIWRKLIFVKQGKFEKLLHGGSLHFWAPSTFKKGFGAELVWFKTMGIPRKRVFSICFLPCVFLCAYYLLQSLLNSVFFNASNSVSEAAPLPNCCIFYGIL